MLRLNRFMTLFYTIAINGFLPIVLNATSFIMPVNLYSATAYYDWMLYNISKSNVPMTMISNAGVGFTI